MTNTDRLENLRRDIATFALKRDWQQFHTPKNLAMALSVECAELVELFQWLTPDQSRQQTPAFKQRISEEIGDIMIYLTMIGASFDIDPIEAAEKKMELNEAKYPCP